MAYCDDDFGRKRLGYYLISTKFRLVSGKGSQCTLCNPTLNLIPFKVVGRHSHPAADAYMAKSFLKTNAHTHTLSLSLSLSLL